VTERRLISQKDTSNTIESTHAPNAGYVEKPQREMKEDDEPSFTLHQRVGETG
jgi:hypothetical protein